MNFQKEFNLSIIFTVFDFPQNNYYNINFFGKASHKEMNKNTHVFQTPELKKENCHFTFEIPKDPFPRKIKFIEPINSNLNFNEYIFGILNFDDCKNAHFFTVYKKLKDEYRPRRIVEPNKFLYIS
jgi:hypothetical protein